MVYVLICIGLHATAKPTIGIAPMKSEKVLKTNRL